MDKRKYKKSKEEIAREFDLPERKSKIATIMKQDGQAYCICRTSDCSRFMIGCDGCEEWYHGDCINITEKDAKYIKQYFCQKCRQEDPTLQIVFRVVGLERRASVSIGSTHSGYSGGVGSNGGQAPLSEPVIHKRRKTKETTTNFVAIVTAGKPGKRCGTCDACRRPNCNKCEACQQRISHKPRCLERICMNQRPRQPYNTAGRKKEKLVKERSRKRNRSVSPEVFINPELEGLRHCFGPSCLNNARTQSKYCSDECGIKLATSRIFHMLTPRLQERNLTPCRAAEENKKQLEQIRKKQLSVRRALADLDLRQGDLDMVVARAKTSTIDPKRANDNNDFEDEQSMYCITCGHEIHSRTAIKHMEKCFNKYESQASFGSIFKTRIEGNSMFCDFYNPASKTYCKRLRVLCPEHSKDPKISDTDVCGAPIINDDFCLTGEYCRAPKKNCFKHYAWEKMRRAEIDLERVRQWLKLDELMEQERQIRQQMSNRAGLLGLMLHSTYDHEVLEELVRKQQQHMLAMQKINTIKMEHRKKKTISKYDYQHLKQLSSELKTQYMAHKKAKF